MRINSKFILKLAIYIAFTLLFLLTQTGITGGLNIFGVKPDLILCVAVVIALFENTRYAATYSMCVGVIFDHTFSSPFLMAGFLLFFTSYLTSYLSKTYLNKSLVTAYIFLAPALVAREIIAFFYMLGTWDKFSAVTLFTSTILPEMLLTAATLPIVYFALRYTAGRINYAMTFN